MDQAVVLLSWLELASYSLFSLATELLTLLLIQIGHMRVYIFDNNKTPLFSAMLIQVTLTHR